MKTNGGPIILMQRLLIVANTLVAYIPFEPLPVQLLVQLQGIPLQSRENASDCGPPAVFLESSGSFVAVL